MQCLKRAGEIRVHTGFLAAAAATSTMVKARRRGNAPLELAALGVPQDEAAVLAAAGQLLICLVPRQRKDAVTMARKGGCEGRPQV